MDNAFEAVTEVLFSVYAERAWQMGKNHFLTPAIEDEPIAMGVKRLESLGCSCKTIPLNQQGQLTRDALEEAIRPRTALVSFSGVNSLTGVIHPLEKIVQLCRDKDVLSHVDVTHLLGYSDLYLRGLDSDFMSFERGLFVKKGFPHKIYRPHAESAYEPERSDLEAARLQSQFEQRIQEEYPEAQFFFRQVPRLPISSVIAFPGVASAALHHTLPRQGVSAQRLPELNHTALSFKSNQLETAEIIVKSAKKLRAYSHEL